MKKLLYLEILFLMLIVHAKAQPIFALGTENKDPGERKDMSKMETGNEKIPVFVFNVYSLENNDLPDENSSNFFGELAGKKKMRLQETYTFSTPIAPGNPGTKTIVRKPAIYNAVVRLEKYYRKQVKKGECPEEEARASFLKVLDVAQAAFPESTTEFEQELSSTKNIETIAQIFNKAIVKTN